MDHQDKEAWFLHLYERYYRAIVSYFVRSGFPHEEARELAQEAFLRVYQGMKGYEGRGDFAYLKTTATRIALNAIRAKHAVKREVEIVSLDGLPVPESPTVSAQRMGEPQRDFGESLIEEEEAARQRRWLSEAILRLPEGPRQCVLLRVQGSSYRDIARALKITEDAVKSRLHEARKRLREELTEHEGLRAQAEDERDR